MGQAVSALAASLRFSGDVWSARSHILNTSFAVTVGMTVGQYRADFCCSVARGHIAAQIFRGKKLGLKSFFTIKVFMKFLGICRWLGTRTWFVNNSYAAVTTYKFASLKFTKPRSWILLWPRWNSNLCEQTGEIEVFKTHTNRYEGFIFHTR